MEKGEFLASRSTSDFLRRCARSPEHPPPGGAGGAAAGRRENTASSLCLEMDDLSTHPKLQLTTTLCASFIPPGATLSHLMRHALATCRQS
eukprot:scaffold484_cov60-Phaeocystis_antarctica.AAC.2